MGESEEKIKHRVSLLAVILNSMVAVTGIAIGLMAGSMAVLAYGIDSSTDILTSLTMLITVKIASKPPDKTHPYGHERAETIGAKIISFVIFYAGASLLFESTKRLITGDFHRIMSPLPLAFALAAMAIKSLLLYLEWSVGKKTGSKAMLSEAANMANDILSSSLVLAGVIFNRLGIPWLDPLVGILLSLLIIRTALGIFRDSIYELMDGIPPEEMDIYQEIEHTLNRCESVLSVKRLRIRKMGKYLMVDADIAFPGDYTLSQINAISRSIENRVKSEFPNVKEVRIFPVAIDGRVDNGCKEEKAGEKPEELQVKADSRGEEEAGRRRR